MRNISIGRENYGRSIIPARSDISSFSSLAPSAPPALSVPAEKLGQSGLANLADGVVALLEGGSPLEVSTRVGLRAVP